MPGSRDVGERQQVPPRALRLPPELWREREHMRVDHRFAVLPHVSGMIGAQSFDEERAIGGVQDRSKLRIQSGRHCPRRPDLPGADLDQVPDGLAEVIPVSVLHGDPRVVTA